MKITNAHVRRSSLRGISTVFEIIALRVEVPAVSMRELER